MLPSRALALNASFATRRLRIEPLLADHAPLLFEGLQHPAIYQWISSSPPLSVDTLAAALRKKEARLSPDGKSAWLAWAVLSADGLIGKLDAEVTRDDVATNVGFLFFPAYWGLGFATEAVSALAEHLRSLGVSEQRATVTVGNGASARVLERASFRKTAILRANDVIRGVACDDMLYVLRSSPRAACEDE